MRLEDAVTEVLNRLADKENQIWSRDEIALYFKDGLDQFCRRTKCLWDVFIIENLPKSGNWQTDLERYLAEQISGFGLTDERAHFTAEDERDKPLSDRFAGGRTGPAMATSPSDTSYLDDFSNITTDSKQVDGGEIPQSTVEVSRVAYDKRTLTGVSSQRMRELDPQYENRSGNPNWFVFDKDGMFYIRVVPAAQGDASYDTVSGSWGTLTQRLDSDSAVADTIDDGGLGGFGILRYRDDCFPSGGPHGSPTRIHPDSNNIKVEVYRLNRDLDSHEVEIPLAYQKYPIFWAMHKALERTGRGQDMELSDHFRARFERGVDRMERKNREMDRERAGRLAGIQTLQPWGLGDPQPPYPFGIPF